jgi:hypothetical protein
MNSAAQPLAYDASMETPEAGEAETIAELVQTLDKIATIVYDDSGHAERGVHAKSHGLLQGELTVADGLPPELRQGLFAQPKSFPVVLRFSTSPGDVLADAISTPRGVGIKIFDVEGQRLPGDNEEATQDFLLVDGPAFLAPNVKKFLGSLKLLAGTTDKAPTLKRALSLALRGAERAVEALGGKSPTLVSLGGHAPVSILGATFFTQAPILFGQYVAKLSLVPVSPNLIASKERKVDIHNDDNAIRDDVINFFGSETAEWELRAQLCTDLEKMPIEDSSVIWPEDQSPFRTVARLRVGPQTAWSPERSKIVDDGMAFNPWHCLAAHRPLGGIMRARRVAYAASMQKRFSLNRCPFHQPSSTIG